MGGGYISRLPPQIVPPTVAHKVPKSTATGGDALSGGLPSATRCGVTGRLFRFPVSPAHPSRDGVGAVQVDCTHTTDHIDI